MIAGVSVQTAGHEAFRLLCILMGGVMYRTMEVRTVGSAHDVKKTRGVARRRVRPRATAIIVDARRLHRTSLSSRTPVKSLPPVP